MALSASLVRSLKSGHPVVAVELLFLAALVIICVPFLQRWWARLRYSQELPPLVVPVSPAWAVDNFVSAGLAPAFGSPARAAPTTTPEAPPAAAETVRFYRPGHDVLQLLPGRLEIVAGEQQREEFRFVRLPGEPADVILGRNPGRSPPHISLRSNTVSRQHARLRFANGMWFVSNLSQTNPVVVNDEELSAAGAERPLADGDHMELGEVVLRFHAR